MNFSNDHINDALLQIAGEGIEGVHESAILPETKRETLINYLLEHDLIEVDDIPDIYYLTDRGYEAIDNGGWHDESLEHHQDENKEYGVKYRVVPSEEEVEFRSKEKEFQLSSGTKISLLSIFVLLGTYLINGNLDFLKPDRNNNQPTIPSNIKFEQRGDTVYFLEVNQD
ncbi:MAG: hypothetical protein ACPG21_11865 [Crocinitomicaceae bacterium]